MEWMAITKKLKNDLKVYHPGKTESTFIEIICLKSTNAIVDSICKYPTLQINDFKSDFISNYYQNYKNI